MYICLVLIADRFWSKLAINRLVEHSFHVQNRIVNIPRRARPMHLKPRRSKELETCTVSVALNLWRWIGDVGCDISTIHCNSAPKFTWLTTHAPIDNLIETLVDFMAVFPSTCPTSLIPCPSGRRVNCCRSRCPYRWSPS